MKIENWEDFEEKIKKIYSKVQRLKTKENASKVSTPLFRGQSDAAWELKTTLDRLESNFSVEKYYRIIRSIKSAVESYTSNRWQLPTIERDLTQLDKYDTISMPSYEFMTHLRHNCFPSPLLDWTRSPYIAAFFAFNEDKKTDPAIYVYIEFTGKGKTWRSDKAKICSLGPNVTTHKRHHLQQSEYTFCIKGMDKKYSYAPHEEVISRSSTDQDIIEKYSLPYSERAFFLNKLNQMNINAYSLFENEEGLMNKLANEELLIKNL